MRNAVARSVVTKFAKRSLLVLVPLLMGGCPEVQNEAIDAFETATLQVVGAAVTAIFDEIRPTNSR